MSMMASKFHAWAREISEPLAARLRRSNANPALGRDVARARQFNNMGVGEFCWCCTDMFMYCPASFWSFGLTLITRKIARIDGPVGR